MSAPDDPHDEVGVDITKTCVGTYVSRDEGDDAEWDAYYMAEEARPAVMFARAVAGVLIAGSVIALIVLLIVI